MTRVPDLHRPEAHFRIGPWHGDDRVAYIALLPEVLKPSEIGVMRCLDRLRAEGYHSAITAALRTHELGPFISAGFTPREALLVLQHDLADIAEGPSIGLRRARRGDRAGVLEIDHAAFQPAWRLDARGLAEALRATPVTRFRVGDTSGLKGYAVVGRAGSMGYLQRLAVHPDHGGQGLGSALVTDALRWARRRGAGVTVVNTQQSNERAIRLYQRLGFRLDGTHLTVLELDLFA